MLRLQLHRMLAQGALHRIPAILALALAGAWASWFLLSLPATGAADNGDFYRVGRAAGLVVTAPAVDPAGHSLVRLRYPIARKPHGPPPVTASLIVQFTRWFPLFPWSAGENGAFDIRRLGLCYLAVSAVAAAAAFRAGVAPTVVVLTTWVLVDPGYLAYFTSLYSEPAALVAVFGLALALWRWTARASRRGFAGLSVFVLTGAGAFSRAPMAILPGLVAFVLFVHWMMAGRPSLRPLGVGTVVAFALAGAAAPLYFTVGSGPRFADINAFHSVFLGPVSVSDDPAGGLERLGLSRSYAPLVGKSYFDAHPSRALLDELARIPASRRIAAYAADPSAVVRVVRRLSSELATTVTMPSYERPDAPARHDVVIRFASVRRALLSPVPFAGGAVLALCVGLGAASALGRVRLRVSAAVLGFLVLVCVSQVVIAVWGDGLFGIGRHLLVARFAFDSLCALLLFEGGTALRARFVPGSAVPASADQGSA